MSEPQQPADAWDAIPPNGPYQGAQGQQVPPGYGYPPPPGPYYMPYPVRRTNGLAIAAMVCGICGFLYFIPAILGIVFGTIAIRQTKRDGTEGRGMAITGLITGVCWLTLLAFIIIMIVLH